MRESIQKKIYNLGDELYIRVIYKLYNATIPYMPPLCAHLHCIDVCYSIFLQYHGAFSDIPSTHFARVCT